MTVECPSCGHDSETEYRCDDCGRDLAKVDTTSTGDRAIVGGGE